jgi:hypothetical protein
VGTVLFNSCNAKFRDLGFPVSNLHGEKTHIYATTYFSPGRYRSAEESKKELYLPYKKYGMRHYGHSFNRPSSKKSELQELWKAFNVYYHYFNFYYDYFKEGSQGYYHLKSFYPDLLNTKNYKGEATIVPGSTSGGESYWRLLIRITYIFIAALCQCLLYVDFVQKREKICNSLNVLLSIIPAKNKKKIQSF